MRITYDSDADAAYVYLKDRIAFGEVVRTELCDVEIQEGAVILGFDSHRKLVGIEILGAGKLLNHETLNAASGSGRG